MILGLTRKEAGDLAGAIAFYERLGFTPWGSDRDAVTLVRPLDDYDR